MCATLVASPFATCVTICTGAPGSTMASPAPATHAPNWAFACSIMAGSCGIPDPWYVMRNLLTGFSLHQTHRVLRSRQPEPRTPICEREDQAGPSVGWSYRPQGGELYDGESSFQRRGMAADLAGAVRGGDGAYDRRPGWSDRDLQGGDGDDPVGNRPAESGGAARRGRTGHPGAGPGEAQPGEGLQADERADRRRGDPRRAACRRRDRLREGDPRGDRSVPQLADRHRAGSRRRGQGRRLHGL